MVFYTKPEYRLLFRVWICSLGIAMSCMGNSQDPHFTWQDFSLGSPSLSIKLPGAAEPMETQIQPSMLDIIQAYYAYDYSDTTHGIFVMLIQTTYANHIHPDFAIIADQTIRDMTSHGALNIHYKTQGTEIEKKKGFRQQGTLEHHGDKMDFTTTVLLDGAHVWKVIVYARTGDAIAKHTAQIINTSMSFKED